MACATVFQKNSILRWGIIVLFFALNVIGVQCATASITFTDITEKTGITFKHVDGSSGEFYIMETISAGLALFDYDNDGDIDIYFLNGSALKGAEYKTTPRNALYRNDGNLKFTDVTEQSGTGDTGFGSGVTIGDYDNDGDLDIYLNNYGPNVLYQNNGDGTFTDVTKKAGVADGARLGAGACFLDTDNDGDLDLYVSRYVKFSYDKNVIFTIEDYPAYPSPVVYVPEPDALYLNNGDGTFTDISKESGIAKHRGTGMGMVCGDYDNDGDVDIFIANDGIENFLFQNNGNNKFEEIGLIAGVAYDFAGKQYGSMGVDCGDYNNDGLLDLYVTSDRWTSLYKNLGNGLFEDVTFSTGAGDGMHNYASWGTGFADFDNDGDRDIFVAIGHIQPNVDKYSDHLTYFARNEILMNTGDGKFVNITDKAGDGMKVKLSTRGAALGDMDNDGDIDIVVLNSRREPTILRNDSVNDNHWIEIRLKGVKSNRNGIGAHVKVVTKDLSQLDEVHSGRGYQGHYGLRLHFGVGKHKKIDRIEVKWPEGTVDVLKNVKADQVITITEGKKTTQ